MKKQTDRVLFSKILKAFACCSFLFKRWRWVRLRKPSSQCSCSKLDRVPAQVREQCCSGNVHTVILYGARAETQDDEPLLDSLLSLLAGDVPVLYFLRGMAMAMQPLCKKRPCVM
jgi:hypothetical protein